MFWCPQSPWDVHWTLCLRRGLSRSRRGCAMAPSSGQLGQAQGVWGRGHGPALLPGAGADMSGCEGVRTHRCCRGDTAQGARAGRRAGLSTHQGWEDTGLAPDGSQGVQHPLLTLSLCHPSSALHFWQHPMAFTLAEECGCSHAGENPRINQVGTDLQAELWLGVLGLPQALPRTGLCPIRSQGQARGLPQATKDAPCHGMDW